LGYVGDALTASESSRESAETLEPECRRRTALEQYRRHVNTAMAGLCEMLGAGLEVRSEGCYIFNEQGRPFLDCGGFNVFLLGHRHPRVVEAVKQQLDSHPLTSRLMLNEQFAQAACKLAEVAPPGLQYVWLANSGAEAVEAGLKLAWLNGCQRLVAMEGAYHGKTLGALSVTGKPAYRTPFEPLLPEVCRVPFADADALARAIGGAEKCCVILEPVQAECGVIIPPVGYLKDVEYACRQRGAFLILDEISTGLGRLGCWWGADRDRVVPDVLLAGKALSGGVMPVSAALCSAEVYAPLNREPLLHTSTFAGNPLAAVAAKTAVEVIEEEQLVARSQSLGKRLLRAVRATMFEQCAHLVSEVRGLGLLIGIEFAEESRATRFIFELLQRGVVASHSLNAGCVVRLTPPAVMQETDVEWLLSAVHDSAVRLGSKYKKRAA
jgi:putrescine aminotransferase